jgi:hypothetical protein
MLQPFQMTMLAPDAERLKHWMEHFDALSGSQ